MEQARKDLKNPPTGTPPCRIFRRCAERLRKGAMKLNEIAKTEKGAKTNALNEAIEMEKLATQLEKKLEKKPITVVSEKNKKEFELLVKKLIEDKTVEKTIPTKFLINFVMVDPSVLGLTSNLRSDVEEGLFDYFNEKFMDLAKNKNSNPDEVTNMKNCASAFANSLLRRTAWGKL